MRRATIVYLLLALAWAWPLPLHLATRFTPDPGDPLLLTYVIWWNAHAVPLTRAWWNAPFYWPMHGTLALTDHLAGLSPLTTPIQWLGGSPLVAYNLTLIASTWWTGLATHALVRRLTSSTLAAFVGGIAFAYAPYRAAMVGHLQIYACWWLPLVLLALHAYYEDGRSRWLALCAAAWFFQGLTNGYFLLFTPVLVACWLGWFTRRARLAPAARVVAACGIAAILMVPFLLEYRTVQTAQGLSRTRGEMVAYSARPASFLSATPLLRVWHTPAPLTTEQYLFPGVTAVTLTLVGLVAARRDRRFFFYVAAAAVMTALAFGPAEETRSVAMLWHPYSWFAWLPGFNGLRVPSRFFMYAALCLAVAGALAFDALARRPRLRAPLALAVFAGLFVDGAIRGLPLGVPPGALAIHEPGARVIALPFNEGSVAVVTMYRSMAARVPVVNGYAGYIPSHADVIDWALRRRDPTVLSELRRGHPLLALVTASDDAASWKTFVAGQAGAELVGVQSGGAVYRLPALPYARSPRPAAAAPASVRQEANWLIADLGRATIVRAVELTTNGQLTRLPASLTIQSSLDSAAWTAVYDERPGAAALVGALDNPRTIPVRIELPDVTARYVRVNAPAFRTGALSVLTPSPPSP